jgi:hypothetical protein
VREKEGVAVSEEAPVSSGEEISASAFSALSKTEEVAASAVLHEQTINDVTEVTNKHEAGYEALVSDCARELVCLRSH